MKKYKLNNLDCASCALKLENRIGKMAGVDSVSIDFAALTMHIETDNIDAVKHVISEVEPDVTLVSHEGHNHEHGDSTPPPFPIFSLILMILGITAGQLGTGLLAHISSILYLAAFFTSGYKVITRAVKDLAGARLFDENFLMTISTTGAIIIGEIPEAAGVMIFYSVGEYFQEKALNRSRSSIRSLMELRPDKATIIHKNGSQATVDTESVTPGDFIIVRPGDRVPLDGTVVEGMTYVDSSSTTGEHRPVKISEGEQILSGHIVKDSTVIVKVEKSMKESSISKIMEMVENASHRKAKTEQFISRFARFYTPVVVFSALLIAFIPPLFIPGQPLSTWVYRALVMLVISCPCALVISIPLGYFGGIGASSAAGILVKGSDILDRLTSLKTIVFDKTGTLTKGKFNVMDIIPKNGFTKEELIRYAVEAESQSTHPIAMSIRRYYGKEGHFPPVDQHQAIPGMGVMTITEGVKILVGNDRILHKFNIEHDTCEIGGTVAHIAVDGIYAGFITVGDSIKEEAYSSITALKKLGVVNTVMLTGDSPYPAGEIAGLAGIDTFHSELTPSDKVTVLEQILAGQPAGAFTAFAGDGINDAPVLMRSDIGISMGKTGSDAAIETSDVVLIDDDLSLIPKAVRIARRTRNIVRQNIVIALGIKMIFLVSGAMGHANMWEAVFADIGVALIAVFNSMRVQRKSIS